MRLEFHKLVASDISRIMDYYEEAVTVDDLRWELIDDRVC